MRHVSAARSHFSLIEQTSITDFLSCLISLSIRWTLTLLLVLSSIVVAAEVPATAFLPAFIADFLVLVFDMFVEI